MTAASDSTAIAQETQPVASDLSLAQWQATFRSHVLSCLSDSLTPYEDGKAQSLDPTLQPLISQLQTLRQKLSQNALQIAVFGYVSRGKSALLNGLLEEPILPIGALNGVTQWPRSIRWVPFPDEAIPWQVELVDTPGLGEVDGSDRAEMAMNIAGASDLLLFVIAGRPNSDELKTLKQIIQTKVPLLLIANKADLFPDLTPADIWKDLGEELKAFIQPSDIVLTAANPAAKKVRNEWPDGHVTEEWDVPPANVTGVSDRIKHYLTSQAFSAVMRNILEQTDNIQRELATISTDTNRTHAIAQWQRYGTIKSIAIALLPFWWLDGSINLLMDLLLVRALVKLYELPTNRHNVEELWRTLFFSLFGVLACDMASGVGLGLSAAMGNGVWSLGGILLWGSTAVLQFLAASYGARRVFDVTNTYLVDGVTFSPQGTQSLMETLQAYDSSPSTAKMPEDPNAIAPPSSS